MDFFSIPAVSMAISIVICWALFGVACSMIHETVVRTSAERGRFLKSYLLRQLDDSANDINWGLELYRQGTISLLDQDVQRPTDNIDPSVFAASLVAAVAGSHLVRTKLQAFQQQLATNADANPAMQTLQATLSSIKDPTLYHFKAAILLLHPSEQLTLLSSVLANAELKASTADSSESLVYTHLVDGLNQWYQGLSVRLSTWYKKKTKRRLFWLGLLVALLLNVDSLQLFTYFNANPQARQAVIAYYERDSAYLNNLTHRIDSGTRDTSALTARDVDSLKTQAKTYIDKMKMLTGSAGLPIGFAYSVFREQQRPAFRFYLLKLLGIIVSAFAASLGGPFWFDLIKKAYSIKSKV
jgi:hypothetical protein